MDDPFKTVGYLSAPLLTGLQSETSGASSHSAQRQAFCLQNAKTICACYRRDEAHDPNIFAAALAAVLGLYSDQVVAYVADPRTGIAYKFPMGLPNIGQVHEFCDEVMGRLERLSQPNRSRPRPIAAPTLKPGQHSYADFLDMAKRGECAARPAGRFE